jgi:hypothetical protein
MPDTPEYGEENETDKLSLRPRSLRILLVTHSGDMPLTAVGLSVDSSNDQFRT